MRKVRKIIRKKSFWAALVILVVAVIAVLELTNTTYIFHKKTAPSTIPVKESKSTSSDSKKSSSSSSSNKSSGSVSNQAETPAQNTKVPSSTGGSTSSNLDLVEPYGNFVSNHTPGQHGSSTQEQSTCNSTPGASCYIQFTNTSTGQVSKLPAHPIESNGSTLWLWDANTLTSGQWTVKAVASLNGQTKTATDSIKLVVQ